MSDQAKGHADPCAVELGRKGGGPPGNGGKKRALAIGPVKRKAIAAMGGKAKKARKFAPIGSLAERKKAEAREKKVKVKGK